MKSRIAKEKKGFTLVQIVVVGVIAAVVFLGASVGLRSAFNAMTRLLVSSNSKGEVTRLARHIIRVGRIAVTGPSPGLPNPDACWTDTPLDPLDLSSPHTVLHCRVDFTEPPTVHPIEVTFTFERKRDDVRVPKNTVRYEEHGARLPGGHQVPSIVYNWIQSFVVCDTDSLRGDPNPEDDSPCQFIHGQLGRRFQNHCLVGGCDQDKRLFRFSIVGEEPAGTENQSVKQVSQDYNLEEFRDKLDAQDGEMGNLGAREGTQEHKVQGAFFVRNPSPYHALQFVYSPGGI